jgi:hypothetical protein
LTLARDSPGRSGGACVAAGIHQSPPWGRCRPRRTASARERSTDIESVLGEFPDKLDELVGSVAVAPGEAEQLVHLLEHDSVLGCAGDSDSLAAAELQ